MEVWKIIVIDLSVILFVILLLFAIAALCHKTAFGKRYDKNPLLKYFTAKDFGLTADEFPLGCLYGAIYNGAKTNGEVIIFVHGMGPGHCAYMTEIAYFCNLGYTVVAVDSLGCGLSLGKKIKGMYEGVISAVDTVDFVQKQFENSKVYLVGHSWGGYSALCASAARKVDKVVAISAPSTPAKTLQCGAKQFIGGLLAAILSPFWWLINLTVFGKKGNANAAKCASNNNTPTLLIHGDSDKIVGKNNAVINKADGKNIQKLIVKGKAHNPYNTVAAEQKLAELSAALRRADKDYFSNFDFTAATEEDAAVMSEIVNFLQK
ncbi:MAG: alpha/beta hydrolase [Clostridia bacterium]|nr:alpha/beta hydrolase [Clostridia bacterium]